MKCINKKRRRRRNRKRELRIRLTCTGLFVLSVVCCIVYFTASQNRVKHYETEIYRASVHQAELFADELCVPEQDVFFEDFYRNDKFHGALFFDIENQEIIYSENVNEKLRKIQP